jgi:hypothetical protein
MAPPRKEYWPAGLGGHTEKKKINKTIFPFGLTVPFVTVVIFFTCTMIIYYILIYQQKKIIINYFLF